MDKVALNTKLRQTGKKAAKAIRRNGEIPGVFYMNGKEPISISANPVDMKSLIYTNEAKLVDLNIEGQGGNQSCFIKEMKFCPVTDKLIHFDLLGYKDDEKIIFEVPISITGSSIGVRQGGVLQQNLHKLKIKCLPADLPTKLHVDISKLGLGQVIQIEHLLDDKFEFILPKSTTVVQVVKARTATADAAETSTESTAETESTEE